MALYIHVGVLLVYGFRSEVSEWMHYKTADECENHYKQCYLVRPESPLPGIDICLESQR